MFSGIRSGQPALVLAPMEGVTDAPMRALLTEGGAFAFCVSEFLRVGPMIPPRRVFLRDIPELNQGGLTPSGTPVVVQLLGGDPEKMAEAARRAVEAGAVGIDINFGCPAPTVNRHDGGAVLLKTPHRLEAIVRAVREAVPEPLPVSAKLRLGWEDPREVFANVEAAEAGGARWLVLHGRTKMQGYRPPVHWELIGEARRQVGIPVVANGDVNSLEELKRCADVTGCEHFMLGRGAVADPAFPFDAARFLGTPCEGAEGRPLGAAGVQWVPLMERFVALSAPWWESEHYATRRIKQWLSMAERLGRFSGFETIKKTQTLDELLGALRSSACTLSPSLPK